MQILSTRELQALGHKSVLGCELHPVKCTVVLFCFEAHVGVSAGKGVGRGGGRTKIGGRAEGEIQHVIGWNVTQEKEVSRVGKEGGRWSGKYQVSYSSVETSQMVLINQSIHCLSVVVVVGE